MNFIETELKGAFVVEPDRYDDERGYLMRTWSAEEFERHGLNARVLQCNASYNRVAGTLRGMHYQIAPFRETKFVRCVRGAIFDVIVDLRDDSPTRLRWIGVELTAHNLRALYIPEGFAHGFQTLEADSEIFYQMSQVYDPPSSRGLRWDDPAIGIEWPLPVSILSQRDREHPLIVA
ncbi:MAG: dTDP-4-dehydrorhamnose 3,5-epimerase [Acidobacteriota bacterium]|jgi:dTDP-4-dehydrorhamnose 3,5-epimerase|nr:dTDP-4-dehydrorhamnose 3,5-epimerase [Acidobacteriota bacterium]